jgi:hypothetical protein
MRNELAALHHYGSELPDSPPIPSGIVKVYGRKGLIFVSFCTLFGLSLLCQMSVWGLGKAVLKRNGESMDCSGRYVFFPVRKTGFCLSQSGGCLDGGEFCLNLPFVRVRDLDCVS